MKTIRLAHKIVSMQIEEAWQYPARLFTDLVGLGVRCGVLLLLYAYVFSLTGGEVHGVKYAVIAWSMFFYFAFSTLRLRDLARTITADVRTGNVETLFTRPISYVVYRIWWQIGKGLVSFLCATLLGTAVLAILIDIPETMMIPVFLPSALLVFFGGCVLSLLVYMIVGMCAFWIEETEPLLWIVDKAIMILGGSYLPVALFPDTLYSLARYSPFGASQFVTHTVYDTWKEEWVILLGIQVVWICVGVLILLVMYRHAQKRVSINGG